MIFAKFYRHKKVAKVRNFSNLSLIFLTPLKIFMALMPTTCCFKLPFTLVFFFEKVNFFFMSFLRRVKGKIIDRFLNPEIDAKLLWQLC